MTAHKFFLTLLFLGSFYGLKAQTDFGLKAGLNSSNHLVEYSGDQLESRYTFGYQIGLWMSNSLSERLELISEMSFSKEGFKMGDSTRMVTSFLIVNTSINYFLAENVIIGVGPEFGRNIGTKLISDEVKFDFDNYYKKYVFGWNFGINYKFHVPLMIGIRYHQGINDINPTGIIFTDSSGNIVEEIEIKEVKRNFQLNLYYRF